MSNLADLYDSTADGVVLHVHVQPGAGRSAVVGRHGNALKVRVAAPPVEGRANQAALVLLAEAFGLAPAEVELVGGATSRAKRVRLAGLDADEAEKRLRVALEGAKRPAERPGPAR